MQATRFRTLCLSMLVCGSVHAQAERARTLAAPASDEGDLVLVEQLRHAEYRFGPVRGELDVWSAPNRAQELRSRVSERGLEVFPRATSAEGRGAPWKLALATTRFGRADGAFALPRATVSAAGERAELERGYLLEWFVNEARGIGQGWTIFSRPSGAEAVSIGLTIGAGLSLRIEEGGRSGALVDACGEAVLRQRDLRAFDATGRALVARLVPAPAGVTIEVDDAGAAYPLTVELLLTGPAWAAESDQAGAAFGTSVATAGDVNGDGHSDVIVGAPLYDGGEANEGRAYVYLGSPTGLGASAAWTAESDQASARFGTSVATAGDVNGDGFSDVIVGAPLYDDGQSDEGRVYVYLGSPSGLAASPAWNVASDQAGAFFGWSVATAGDVDGDGYSEVIVGALFQDNGESDEGRAHVYHGSAGGLALSPAWTAESNQGTGVFGWSVASAGDVNGDGYSDVIVGAPLYDNGESDEGRAYVYHGSASGLAASPAWTAEADQASTSFGAAVSSAGDVNGDGYSDVIVGAPQYANGANDEGRAHVYHGSAGGLAASPAWTAESDQTFAIFGGTVSAAGDVNGDGYSDVIVGASGFDAGQTDEGRAYLYCGSASGLTPTPVWTAESDETNARFADAVALAGDVNGDGYSDVIVGARAASNGQSGEGRAFAYHGSPRGLAASSAWNAEPDTVDASLGVAVASAGDVNGDGYSDVIAGASGYDNGQVSEGRAFLYLGSASGLEASPAWSAESDQAFALFGASVASAGDVNGDGHADVIVGAYAYDGGHSDEGRAYVYHGSASGLAASPAWTAESDQASAFFGIAAASAGDVNGDGYSDVIVGAGFHENGQTDEGRVWVYHGSPSGLAASAAWSAESDQASSFFGIAAATAGDVNGDGYADVLVGAYAYDDGNSDEGGAFVYHGSASGLAASPAWTASPDQDGAWFGSALSTAGDVNGDGYSDVIIGASALSDDQTLEGRAYLYLGSASGLAASPAWTAESDQAHARFGVSVASAGDVNADGYSDVVVGAYGYDGGETNEGRAYVFHGSASGLAASPAWTAESDQADAVFGQAVAGAGDVNGDGYSDVIVGSPGYNGGQDDEGRLWVYLGNEGRGGLLRELQQRTRSGTRPLSVVGLSGASGLFRIRCEFAKNAAGYSWASPSSSAHLEWEVKPFGVAFDGSGIGRGADQSLVPSGGTLTFDELVSIADAAGHARTTRVRVYHWRARVATNSTVFPHSAWFSAPGNNVTEAKLRKPAETLP